MLTGNPLIEPMGKLKLAKSAKLARISKLSLQCALLPRERKEY